MLKNTMGKRFISLLISAVLIFNLFSSQIIVSAEELKKSPDFSFASNWSSLGYDGKLNGGFNGKLFIEGKDITTNKYAQEWLKSIYDNQDKITISINNKIINGNKGNVVGGGSLLTNETYYIAYNGGLYYLHIKLPTSLMVTETVLKNYLIKIDVPGYNTVEFLSKSSVPAISGDNTNNKFEFNTQNLTNNIELTFTDNHAWRQAITDIKLDGTSIFADKSKYTIQAGKIILDKSLFATAKDYSITINATKFTDSIVTQKITSTDVKLISGGTVAYQKIVFELEKWYKVSEVVGVSAIMENGSSTGLIYSSDSILNRITVSEYANTSGEYSKISKIKFDIRRNNCIYSLEYNLPIPKAKPVPVLLYNQANENKNTIGENIEVVIGYSDSDKNEVREWAFKIFSVKYDNYICPVINCQDAENGEITLTINATELYAAGPINFTFYSEGYNTTNELLTVKSVGKTPAFYHDNLSNFYPGEDLVISYPNADQEFYKGWYDNLICVVAQEKKLDINDKSQIVFEPASKSIIIKDAVINDNLDNIQISFASKGYEKKAFTLNYRSSKPSPIVYPMTNAENGKDVVLTFTDNEAWKNKISQITVGNKILDKAQYTIGNGKITIAADEFLGTMIYPITIKSEGFEDTELVQDMTGANSSNSFNPDKYSTKTALNIVCDGKTIAISERQLYELAAKQGNIAYDFSTYNTWPTFETTTYAFGPTIKSIFELAGINTSNLAGDSLIKVASGADGFNAKCTVDKLLNTDRFYFPNAGKINSFKGKTLDAKAWETAYDNSMTVPAIIELGAADGTLRFGQLNPQEQQKDALVKYLTSTNNPGTIEILSDKAKKFEQVTPSIENGSTVKPGTVLDFKSTNGRAGIFYTVGLNGEVPKDPTELDTMYNYAQFLGQKHNSYVFTDAPTIIKVKVIGRWGLDSDVMTLYFNGAHPKVDVTIDNGAKDFVQIDKNQLLNAVLTQDDIKQMANGSKMSVGVTCNEVSNPSDANLIIKALNGKEFKGIRYFDIDITKYIDGKAQSVTKLNAPIKITIPVPKELVGLGYEFAIVRVHDGVATTLKATVSNDGKYITFETDLFSTYALVYKDPASANRSVTNPQTPKANKPVSTNDDSEAIAYCSVALSTAAAIAFISNRRKKLSMEA